MQRPIHFEFHSADPQKAAKFFECVFGWKARKWDGPMEYWLFETGQGAGIDGGLIRSRDGQPRTVNTIETDDVDAFCATIQKHGGTIVVPKMAIEGVGWVAYAVEPTGNLFGIMQEDRAAR